jgi:hypothetical protein
MCFFFQGRNSLSDSAGGFTPPSSRYSALDNGRYKSHLLSPDESVACPIAEENLTDYLPWSPQEEEEYVPMERQTRLNLPLVSSINNNNNNNNNNNKYDTSKTAGSPSEVLEIIESLENFHCLEKYSNLQYLIKVARPTSLLIVTKIFY